MATVPIPVPEEHLDEFNRLLLGMIIVGGEGRTEAIAGAREKLDDLKRAFFDEICRASANSGHITYGRLAEVVGIRTEDVVRVIMEVNLVFDRNGAPTCLLMEALVEDGPEGSVNVEPTVLMPRPVARALLSQGVVASPPPMPPG